MTSARRTVPAVLDRIAVQFSDHDALVTDVVAKAELALGLKPDIASALPGKEDERLGVLRPFDPRTAVCAQDGLRLGRRIHGHPVRAEAHAKGVRRQRELACAGDVQVRAEVRQGWLAGKLAGLLERSGRECAGARQEENGESRRGS